MSTSDDQFRPKLAPPRARAPKAQKFISRVLRSISRAGSSEIQSGKPLGPKRGGIRGRGRVAARTAGAAFGIRSRRVIVKIRLVNLRKAGIRSTIAHLRYLERGGVSPEGERGQAYGMDADEVDTRAFEETVRDDRHQFRTILSLEDGAEVKDLRSFTRSVMSQMERDLGTRLEWVAVDHFDTGRPHTHVVIRGKDEVGKDLIIAREYISRGLRMRASEIATEWLGPRTQREIDNDLDRQIKAERWTELDARIEQMQEDGFFSRRAIGLPVDSVTASRLTARLAVLEDMELADRQDSGWRLQPQIKATLKAMGERGDIIRELNRTQSGIEYRVFDPEQPSPPITGRVSGRGWHEESDRGYVLVEGLDGPHHYIGLPPQVDPDYFPVGGIVTVDACRIRAVDRNIAAAAHGGVYRESIHRERLKEGAQSVDPEEFIRSHVRRLEALRRAGIVERLAEGEWAIPDNLVDRGLAYDRRRSGGVQLNIASALPLDRQVSVLAPTWLDRQLIDNPSVPASRFGEELKRAMQSRADFLVSEGFANRTGDRVVLRRDLLETLRDRELQDVASKLSNSTGLTYRPVSSGSHISGIYRRQLDLVSGRYAMLDDEVGFSLVPWRPVLTDRLGQSMSATITGSRVSWDIGRSLGLSI